MAARKKNAVNDTALPAEQPAVSEPTEGGDVKPDAVAEATGEPTTEAKNVEKVAEAPAPTNVDSVQALGFPYNRTLKFGADGEDVKALQKALSSAGYGVEISSVYDLPTLRAVQRLQRAKSLPDSGIVGKHDYAALLGNS